MPTPPVLVDVTLTPDFVTFVYRLGSGRLIPAMFERPAFVRPGISLEGAPHRLEVWTRNPRTGRHPTPDADPPQCLAAFSVYPDTPEGMCALATLGYGPDLQRLPTDPLHA